MPEPSTGSSHPPEERAAGAAVVHKSSKLNQARRRLFPHALVVGIMTGLLAIAFRVCLERGEDLRSHFLVWIDHRTVLGLVALMGLSCLLVGSALYLVLRFCPEASGSGIPHLRLTLREDSRLNWRRIIPVKFCSGLLGIFGGLCLGREGPTIQMGAALGAMWGESHLGKGADRRSLMVTGASAGLAAAFNAPMAGIMFAIEELHINIPDSAFFTAMISCVSADLFARILLGQTPVLQAKLTQGAPPLESLPFFLFLGVLTSGLAWAFNKAIVRASRALAFQSVSLNVLKVLIAGIILAIAGWLYPPLLGGGLILSNRALNGEATLPWLAVMFLLRFALTIGSYSVGTAGGIFAPLLVLGGLLGLLVGEIAQSLIPAAVPEPTAFAVVGMAATFSSVIRAPLTGIVLIIEMTGHYDLILPLMIASFTASLVADELYIPPVYDALLESQLEASRVRTVREQDAASGLTKGNE